MVQGLKFDDYDVAPKERKCTCDHHNDPAQKIIDHDQIKKPKKSSIFSTLGKFFW